MKLNDSISLPISMSFMYICKITKQSPCAADEVILGECGAVPDIHIQLVETLDEGEDNFLLDCGVLAAI